MRKGRANVTEEAERLREKMVEERQQRMGEFYYDD